MITRSGKAAEGAETKPRGPRSRGYPRPQLERGEWICLNGAWDFAIDHEGRWTLPDQVEWNDRIVVPFAPETEASGVGDTGFYRAVWYRKRIKTPELPDGQRLLLHFGAVDYHAMVWVNGRIAAQHEGGYTPFHADVTDLLVEGQEQEIVVRAEDDPFDLAKPRGKQDWQLEPHSIWYPRTTGIWQTVWMERVPETYIAYLRWTPNVERWEIGLEVRLGGALTGVPAPGKMREGLRLHVRLTVGDYILADDTYLVVVGEVHRRIALSDPGIDDFRNELLWYPHTPTLIHAHIQLWDEKDEVRLIDTVRSYTALRSIGVQGDRLVLNSRPYYLRMVLDQGYYPESGLTPPDDEAIRHDVEITKQMGFNGIRAHQRVADPRYLYWCDTLGLLVWEEMPSAYRFTRLAVDRLTREWIDVMKRDVSHPCIVSWVPFNESWGVPDLPDSPAQRHCVQALYHLTKTLDPTRPVIGNDGWEAVATDIVGIHDYDDQPARIRIRYGSDEVMQRLFKRERPGGRLLQLQGHELSGQPIMITEFGGITCARDKEGTWGYSRADSGDLLKTRYTELLEAVRSLPILAGFCYTQFADTYQEANGLLYVDRTPKFPLEDMNVATAGPQGARDRTIENQWRQRMMNVQRHQYLVPAEDYRTINEPR